MTLNDASFGISPYRGEPTIVSGRDRWLLVADARLDNRDELADRVGASRGMSDADLLLAAWIKAGEDSLGWIAGDFALAILDGRTGVLTLARDPTGQAPLFYAHSAGASAFASMPAGLKPFIGQLRIDKGRLAFTACFSGGVDERSHFEGIRRVLPGEVVRLARMGADRGFYWNPPTAAEGPAASGDFVHEYRHLLDQAVADRIKDCSRPVAAHLSSGYDSSAIAATAARLLGSPGQLVAFTSAPNATAPIPDGLARIADESLIAGETAARYGMRHMIVRDRPPLAETVRRQSELCQEPVMSTFNVLWWTQIRKEAAAIGANCLLTAELGNITLNAGGLSILAEWVRRRRYLTWLGEVRLAAARPDTSWRGALFLSFQSRMPQFVVEGLRRRFLGVRPFGEISFLRREWTEQAIAEGTGAVADLGYAERIRMLRAPELGAVRKGALAEDGVDERDPMSDRRLVEFSLRMPPQQLYWRGVSRPLARAALSDRLPRSVIDLKKRGLQAADWAARFSRAEAGAMLEEISASSTAQDLLDLPRMRNAIARWPAQDWNELGVATEYRVALVGALAVGMFSLVHDQH